MEPDVTSDSTGYGTLTAIVLATLTISFFCSICEAALYAVTDGRVEHLAQSGSPLGKRLKRLRSQIDRPIAAILTLNTIANTVGATLAGSVAASFFDSLGVGIFSGVFTLGILYVSEIVPKTLGVLYADTLAPLLAVPIEWTIWSLWPLVWLCRQVTRMFPRSDPDAASSQDDLLALARRGVRTGSLRPDEARWMQNALNLDTLKVADILTPRTVVFSVPKDAPLSEISDSAAGWPHSRVPVTDAGDLDKIIGVVLRREVYEAVVAGQADRVISHIMREPTFVPEAMKVGDLLTKFLRDRRHLFIVADEYGGTAGIVTLEDAIESLLGTEIVDEFDHHTDLQDVARHKAAQKLKNRKSRPPQPE